MVEVKTGMRKVGRMKLPPGYYPLWLLIRSLFQRRFDPILEKRALKLKY